jgi:ABC-type Co2+ transport system permease subunit
VTTFLPAFVACWLLTAVLFVGVRSVVSRLDWSLDAQLSVAALVAASATLGLCELVWSFEHSLWCYYAIVLEAVAITAVVDHRLAKRQSSVSPIG